MSAPAVEDRHKSLFSRIDKRALTLYLAVLVFFFVSGGCGLLYQVVWTRKLVLLFGATSYAVSTVLGIFFAGLGIGSLLGGRLADRTARPLWWYGVFEILIGLWAVLFILMVDWSESAVASLLGSAGAGRTAGIGMRAALAAVYLIVPVTLMGATLPLLAKYASGEMSVRGRRIGTLYSINTFGAVAGTVLAGFFLIPAMGYTQATFIGAAANVAVGILGIIIGRRTLAVEDVIVSDADSGPAKLHEGEGAGRAVALATLAFGISGFCAIALEVLWTRLLVLIFTGTTYAYTTMLASMLCGIALGSALAAPIADRVRRPLAGFGLILLLNAAACLLTLHIFSTLPDWFYERARSAGFSWEGLLRTQIFLSFAALLLPTVLFGVAFPFAVRAATAARGNIGRDVGRLYSANTFAGVAGAIAGGYFIAPLIGTHSGIVALSFVLAFAGVAVVALTPAISAVRKLGFAGAGAAVVLVSAITAPADVSRELNLSYLPEGERLLDYREGVEGTVAVSEPTLFTDGTSRTIFINRVQATATIEKGLKMNRFQGVLPFIFDREYENALFMCFGSGSTLGTLAQWPFDNIDAVEISPDVLGFAHYFQRDNLDVINNPKVTFHIDDGRNYLLTSDKKYDLITFEPMPLALSGVSTFYTQEYYELCLGHLAQGGVVSQWVPLHSLNVEIVQSLIRTFTSVFPHYCAWFINADLFLTGSNEPLRIDFEELQRRIAHTPARPALEPVGLADPVELISMYCMGQDALDRFAEGAPIMRDDLPWAEFQAPKIMHNYKVEVALEAMQPYLERPDDLVYFEKMPAHEARKAEQAIAERFSAKLEAYDGVIEYRRAGLLGSSEDQFLAALEIDPKSRYARYYLKDVMMQKVAQYLQWEDEDLLEESADTLQAALKLVPNEPVFHLLLADIRYQQNVPVAAQLHYRQYLRLGGTAEHAVERARRPAAPAQDGA